MDSSVYQHCIPWALSTKKKNKIKLLTKNSFFLFPLKYPIGTKQLKYLQLLIIYFFILCKGPIVTPYCCCTYI